MASKGAENRVGIMSVFRLSHVGEKGGPAC